jgi:predicted RNA binding protein YcfA (HicA-like mRNA interferase family)
VRIDRTAAARLAHEVGEADRRSRAGEGYRAASSAISRSMSARRMAAGFDRVRRPTVMPAGSLPVTATMPQSQAMRRLLRLMARPQVTIHKSTSPNTSPKVDQGHRIDDITMSKLPVVSGPDLVRALARLGYETDHQTGSLIILRNQLPPHRRLTVPNHKELAKGTLRALVHEAGLTVDQLIELLNG